MLILRLVAHVIPSDLERSRAGVEGSILLNNVDSSTPPSVGRVQLDSALLRTFRPQSSVGMTADREAEV